MWKHENLSRKKVSQRKYCNTCKTATLTTLLTVRLLQYKHARSPTIAVSRWAAVSQSETMWFKQITMYILSINMTQHLLTSLFHHQHSDGLIKRPHRKHRNCHLPLTQDQTLAEGQKCHKLFSDQFSSRQKLVSAPQKLDTYDSVAVSAIVKCVECMLFEMTASHMHYVYCCGTQYQHAVHASKFHWQIGLKTSRNYAFGFSRLNLHLHHSNWTKLIGSVVLYTKMLNKIWETHII